MPINGMVNGHPVELSRLPSWSQDNSYLLWVLYREILSVHARYPLNQVTITREVGSSPPHFHALIDLATNGDWTIHLLMDDALNPLFGVEESHHTAWRWSQVEATRGLRSAIVELLVSNPTLIDTCSFVITP